MRKTATIPRIFYDITKSVANPVDRLEIYDKIFLALFEDLEIDLKSIKSEGVLLSLSFLMPEITKLQSKYKNGKQEKHKSENDIFYLKKIGSESKQKQASLCEPELTCSADPSDYYNINNKKNYNYTSVNISQINSDSDYQNNNQTYTTDEKIINNVKNIFDYNSDNDFERDFNSNFKSDFNKKSETVLENNYKPSSELNKSALSLIILKIIQQKEKISDEQNVHIQDLISLNNTTYSEVLQSLDKLRIYLEKTSKKYFEVIENIFKKLEKEKTVKIGGNSISTIIVFDKLISMILTDDFHEQIKIKFDLLRQKSVATSKTNYYLSSLYNLSLEIELYKSKMKRNKVTFSDFKQIPTCCTVQIEENTENNFQNYGFNHGSSFEQSDANFKDDEENDRATQKEKKYEFDRQKVVEMINEKYDPNINGRSETFSDFIYSHKYPISHPLNPYNKYYNPTANVPIITRNYTPEQLNVVFDSIDTFCEEMGVFADDNNDKITDETQQTDEITNNEVTDENNTNDENKKCDYISWNKPGTEAKKTTRKTSKKTTTKKVVKKTTKKSSKK